MSDTARQLGLVGRLYGGALAAMHSAFLVFFIHVAVVLLRRGDELIMTLLGMTILPVTALLIVCGILLAAGREWFRWLFLVGVVAMPATQLVILAAVFSHTWAGGMDREFPYTMLIIVISTLFHAAGLAVVFTPLRFVGDLTAPAPAVAD